MIRETVTSFDPGWGELIDLDVLDSGDWAGVFRDGPNLFVRTATSKSVAPDGIRFPIIRCLEPGRIALVDTRTLEGRTNAWLLSPPPQRDHRILRRRREPRRLGEQRHDRGYLLRRRCFQ